ncbi:MAG TPA: carbonic anhydrase [Terriglobales bacterium]|nr:carbonic anhydrase [Terriglobales bacterium]
MARRVLGLALCCSLFLFAADKPKSAAAPPSADKLWADLADGNARFVAGKLTVDDDLAAHREKLAHGQAPPVAVLACADSRVGPELLFDKSLGQLFVVRVAGNSADPVGIGSLEYSVEHLGSTMIVVMGHQSCGAVKAACSGGKMPTAGLAAVVEPIKPSCSKVKGKDIESATRDHVHVTAQDLLARSPLLKQHFDAGKLAIVEAYYSLDTGKVERLK